MGLSAQQIAEMKQQDDYRLRIWEENLTRCKEYPGTTPVLYSGHVTGTSYGRYLHHANNIHPKMAMRVIPHPENKYDANATGIYIGDDQIGWVPKAYNATCAKALAEGMELQAEVIKHNRSASQLDARLHVEIRPLISRKRVQDDLNPWAMEPREPAPYFLNTTQPTQPEQNTMAKSINNIVEQNVSLGTSAAFLEAGRIANNQLSSICSKKLPIMVRAYADTALGRLILANLALMARDHFRPNDERLGKLANAMTVSAYQEVLQNFDLEQMIDDMLQNSTIKKALKSIDSAEAKAG